MAGFVVTGSKHPEQKNDEWFFCNVEKGKECTIVGSPRFGETAYDNMGYKIPNYVPVFAKGNNIWKDGI